MANEEPVSAVKRVLAVLDCCWILFVAVYFFGGMNWITYVTDSESLQGTLIMLWGFFSLPALICFCLLGQLVFCPSFPGAVTLFAISKEDTVLQLDKEKLTAFMSLSPRRARFVVRTLPYSVMQYAAITEVEIDLPFLHQSVFYSTERRWRLFCEALSSIPTLHRVKVNVGLCSRGSQAAETLLQHVQNITHLRLSCEGFFHHHPFDGIVATLAQQNHLESLDYSLPITTFRQILPVVQSLPRLNNITLTIESPSRISPNEAADLADFLAVRTLQYVRLSGLHFFEPASWQIFCRGISLCGAEALHLKDPVLPDDANVLLGVALSESNIRTVTIVSRTGIVFRSLIGVLSSLAESPLAPQLKLELHQYQGSRFITTSWAVEERDVLLMIHEAANCTTLVEMKLPSVPYSDALDAALAILLQTDDSSLEALSVTLDPVYTPGTSRLIFPRLRLALRANVKVKCVKISTFNSWLSEALHREPSFLQEVEMITSLNKHDRAYFQEDPGNVARATVLLGAVSNNLNCLYFHVREHPVLVIQESSARTETGGGTA